MWIQHFIDFYAVFFSWSRSENRLLGSEQFALPKLQSISWHSCSEFKFGFSGCEGRGELPLKKRDIDSLREKPTLKRKFEV